jgi:hypothetical protein
MKEKWRPVCGGKYQISDSGRFRNARTMQLLKIGHGATGGYATVVFYDEQARQVTKRVHRLVAAAFLGPCPVGMEVNHKDTNKRNNCLDNLEYVTSKRNHAHARSRGLWSSCRNRYYLTPELVLRIRKEAATRTCADVGKEFGLAPQTVSNIRNYRVWKNV